MSSFDGLGPSEHRDGELDFTVLSQRIELDIDFQQQALTGSTQIVAQPLTKAFKAFALNFRQGRILRATVEGKPATVSHHDPYEKLRLNRGVADIHHHDYLKGKLAASVKESPEPEVKVMLPTRVAVKELDSTGRYTAPQPVARKDSEATGPLQTPVLPPDIDQGAQFAPLKIYLEFRIDNFRDGLQWIGTRAGDGRFPHVFTRNSLAAGNMSSIFPCVDSPNARSLFEMAITFPKTIGDAFRINRAIADTSGSRKSTDQANASTRNGEGLSRKPVEYSITLSEEERALELSVVCSGETIGEPSEDAELGKRTASFASATPVAVRHIGFAVGPFEQVDLSAELREADEEDKLGQNAVKVLGYCLPGRSEELRNTCVPMPKAIDWFTVNCGSFPFPNYKLCFVDDMVEDFADTAGLTMCSNRLLFPDSVIDTLDEHTRTLIFALTSQYFGVNIIAKESSDLWAVIGIAGFMADTFMKKLAGNNEHRFRQKLASDKVFEQDISRYSLHQLGGQLDIDPSEYDFLRLKAPLVLFILDRRLTKQSGSAGLNRIVTRIVLNAKTGDLQNGELTTEYFLRTCEKLGHAKLDSFFKQWVYNAGCPDFMVTQKFNKKKLVVEMTIQQMQSTRPRRLDLTPTTFMRETKENVAEAYAPELQPAFTGPMTIRIHEADGTPYEHIVEVKDVITRFEIPYNTKYKRLKRSKKAKERSIAINGPEQVGESQDDVLLYCLGDTLQSEQEVADWHLVDWTEQQENQMGQESYEWIRMDADFEWIGRMNLSMPIYMYVSQLQQDRDVVAQYESVQRISQQEPHRMGATILVRTLMDRRYFHGIRTAAAMGLPKLAVPHLGYLGLYHLNKAFSELYCFADNPSMPRPNDFTDRASYIVQCIIPLAMTQARDTEGRVPIVVRKFLTDKIKFNDNSYNENNENISDNHYMAKLTTCLIDAVVSMNKPQNDFSFNFDDDEAPPQTEDDLFREQSLNELERYRASDEWTPSYQNVTTLAAIRCLQKLVSSGWQKGRASDILIYTRPEHAPNVRIRAFEALVELQLIRRPSIMQYLLSTLATDESPYLRAQLLRIVGQALGTLAIGDSADVDDDMVTDAESGLVLEQIAPSDERAQELARKSSPEGALYALKDILSSDENFKTSLWSAALSTTLSIQETNALLDVAALLFDPSSYQGRLVLALPLPRKWHVRHEGGGKMRFYRSRKVRTRPSKHSSLSQKDYKFVKSNGVKYTGPLAKEIRDAEEKALADQVANLQKELERQQARQMPKINTGTSHMSPPPLPTPSEGGLKLSLKRRPSIDVGAPAAKLIKLGKGASTPQTPGTPSLKLGKLTFGAKHKATPVTPAPATPRVTSQKPKQSRIVKLKFPTKHGAVLNITKRPSVNTEHSQDSQIPSMVSTDGYFPAVSTIASPNPTNGTFPAAVAATPGPTWNVGGFRNYSVGSASAATMTPIKAEQEHSSSSFDATPAAAVAATPLLPPESPDDVPLAQQRREVSLQAASNAATAAKHTIVVASAGEEPKPPPPAAPSRKIVLKFGKKLGAAATQPPADPPTQPPTQPPS